MIEVIASVLIFVSGLYWGHWFAARSFAAIPKTHDAGTMLLTLMAKKLIDKRKFVGRDVEITADHFFEIGDNKFTLSLCLDAEESAEA
jgi:hypothetical protein